MHQGQLNLFKVKLQAVRQGKSVVVVAQDGVYGHDFGNLFQEKLFHHIAGMNDGVRLPDTVPNDLGQIRRPGAFRSRYMGVGENG